MATAILNEPVEAGNPVLSVESLPLFVYRDQPVVTSSVLAGLYGTTQKCIRENYRTNRERFTEGRHFFKVEGKEYTDLREYARSSGSLDVATYLPRGGHSLMLWTARGSGRHAKMLNTDKAWDVFEMMEESYFNRRKAPAKPQPSPSTLTTSSRRDLQNLIAAKVSHYPSELRPKAFAEAWARVKNKFHVAKYEDIPEEQYPDVVTYILAMEMKVALPTAKTPKALPGTAPGCSIRDYAWFYPGLPETPDMWRRLSFRAADAFEKFGKEIDAIKIEAFRPFLENRKSGATTFFDAAMSPNHALFKVVDDQMRVAYRCVYEALDGLIATYALLRKG